MVSGKLMHQNSRITDSDDIKDKGVLVEKGALKDVKYPKVPINDALLSRLIFNAKGWLSAYGLVIRTEERRDKNDISKTLPITLLPSKFPRTMYQQAVDVQQMVNKLQFLVSIDRDFINTSLKDVAKVDKFINNFLFIYNSVMEEGLAQNILGQIQRTDYMCHQRMDDFCLKQVEVNTSAVGGVASGQLLSCLHRVILRDMAWDEAAIDIHLPENKAFSAVSNALLSAWKAYGFAKGVILMVYEPEDPLAMEFWLIERLFNEINFNTKIRMCKICLKHDYNRLHLDESTKQLFLDGDIEISVIYFMGAVDEQDFPNRVVWDYRLMMERSRAVKIPFVGAILADTKKIQQVLSKRGILERFFPVDVCNQTTTEALRSTFAGFWSLDEDDLGGQNDTIIRTAIRNPENFVLKSQREGGTGRNYFDQSLAVELERVRESPERSCYVLMERLKPLLHQNYLIYPLQDDCPATDCSSELGIFGYLIGDAQSGRVLENRVTGHQLKTKPHTANEAGISHHCGVMDSAFLV